jgi:hypothetical protein
MRILTMRGISLAVAASVVLAACQTPTMPLLRDAQQHCTEGNDRACSIVPQLQAQVTAEQNQQAATVGAGILAGLAAAAVGAAAVSAARQPTYVAQPVVVVCRPYWSC